MKYTPRFRDKNGKVIHLEDTVIVPDPSKEDDCWKHSFKGRVSSISAVFNGLICVVDQEENGWDVEPERLKIIT